jgi:ABC-type sugar transport system ATPase subunit
LGNEEFVYLNLSGQTVIVRRQQSGSIDIGKGITIRPRVDKIVFFDRQNDEVIQF